MSCKFRVLRCSEFWWVQQVGVVTLILSGISVAGQQQQDGRSILPFSALKLAIRTDRQTYVLGQPIAVSVELTNPHKQPVQAHGRFAWGSSYYRGNYGERYLNVMVSRDGKSFERYRPYAMPHINVPPLPQEPMLPGTRWVTKILLFGTKDTPPFLTAAGEVYIKAEFWNVGQREKIASEVVEVTLSAPRGQDAQALEWLRQHNLVHFLGDHYWLRDFFSEKAIESLDAFLSQYAQTVYAPYTRYGLGQVLFYRKDYREAVRHFESIVKQHGDVSIADGAAFLAGECYRLLGEREGAQRWYDEVIQRYPKTLASEKAEQSLDLLRRGKG